LIANLHLRDRGDLHARGGMQISGDEVERTLKHARGVRHDCRRSAKGHLLDRHGVESRVDEAHAGGNRRYLVHGLTDPTVVILRIQEL